jgi:Na+-transporting methylmalonyl-CoA/oxaloacetate decarboxylase gamma subunit
MSPSGNGFGRRTPMRDNPPPRPNPSPVEPTGPSLVDLLTSRGMKQIGGMLLGVAIVFAVITIYVSGMKSAGRALDKHWAENAGYPTLDQLPPRRENTPSTYNELRTACLATAKKAGLSRATNNELDYFVNIRVGEDKLEQHAAFIDCLITQHPGRLCQTEHRAHLVGAVRDYFHLRTRVREEWMMARSPLSAPGVGLVGMPGRHGISAQYPSERTDPRIVSGLRSLIESGHLTTADLGAGFFSRMPGDLGEQLKGAEAKKRTCG